jgi:hypothetical protein
MRKRLFLFALIHFCFGLFCQTVQEKIITFSKSNMGKKVDRGECWDLANAALNEAKADWTPPYKFGDAVEVEKGLKSADILQFTDVKFIFPYGSASFPKHTAIVYKADKKSVTVFHQNFNNKKYVDTLTLNFDQIKNGKIEAYRPKAKKES